MFRLGLSQVIRRVLLVALGLSWVGYLGYLLSNLYRSHGELQNYQREQVLRESGRRAEALSYFFSERSRDLRTLVSGRELQTYFENKALGMSMQYGLSASLYRIREAFDSFRTDGRLGDGEIYQRIVFLDSEGAAIVDSHADGVPTGGAGEPAAWAPLLADSQPSLRVLGDDLVLVAAYQFKSKTRGHLLAWLSVKDIYRHFVGPNEPENRSIALACGPHMLFAPSEAGSLVGRDAFPAIASLSSESPRHFTVASGRGGRRDMLAFLTPVSETALALVTAIPASRLSGVSPLALVIVTGAIGILVVLMGLASVVVHRRALQTMEQLFEKMPFAIVVLAKDRRIGLANDAAGSILACKSPALKGRLWSDFVTHDAGSDLRPAARETSVLGADGRNRAILLTEIPATIVGQDVFLEAFVDQSEIKRLETQLRQAQKLEAVGQLAAGIAHEINTPAQFVQDSITFLSQAFRDLQRVLADYRKAMAEVATGPEHASLLASLKQAEADADIAYVEENAPEAFASSRDGIGRISSIVGALKEFAHPSSRDKAPADLNRAIQNTLTIAHNEYKLVADVETELGDLPPVMCHLSDLNEVFLNLVVNAAHAIADVVGNSGERGKILVRSAAEGDQVRVEIHDTGCGIPEAIRGRVFDPFFTTKEVGRGTGQGLAIAHSVVVDKHGGSLSFESTVGKGTIFTVRVPVHGATLAASAP